MLPTATTKTVVPGSSRLSGRGVLALLVICMAAPLRQAQAETYVFSWNPEVTPTWSQYANWTPSNWTPDSSPLPGINDYVYIAGRCEYDMGAPTSVGGVTVASFTTGSSPDLIQTQGVLSCGSLALGSSTMGGKAYFAQSGGTLVAGSVGIDSYTLTEVDNEWWTAVYDMSGTANLTGPLEGPRPVLTIGERSFGKLIQSGGVVRASGIILAKTAGSSGQYVMTGGEANAADVDVGAGGYGWLDISGGTMYLGTRMQVGLNFMGAANLHGSGKLLGEMAEIRIGVGELAAVGQSAYMSQADTAELVTQYLIVGYTSKADYEMSGGRIDATSIRVGHYGEGNMVQSGGTIIAYANLGGLQIGKDTATATGRFEWRGGFLGANIDMAPNGTFALGRDFLLGDLDSVDGPDFQGSVKDLDTATFEITNGASARTAADDYPDFAVGTLLLGSPSGPGRLSLDRGSVSVRSLLDITVQNPEVGVDAHTGIRTVVNGTTPGVGYGQVYGSGVGVAQLDGTLTVDFERLFAPRAGDVFDVLTGFEAISGIFSNVAVTGVKGTPETPFEFDVAYDNTNGRVRLTALTDAEPYFGRIESANVPSDGVVHLGGGALVTYGADLHFSNPLVGRLRGEIRQVPKELKDEVLPPLPEELLPVGMTHIQYWDLSFDGDFSGTVDVTFAYDDAAMFLGETDESLLVVQHFNKATSRWEVADTLILDTERNLIGIRTDRFSPFVIGVDAPTPVIVCPPDVTVTCGDSIAPDHTGTATTDPGSEISFADESVPGCGNTAVIARTWTATNAHGRSASARQIITVVDTTPPSITAEWVPTARKDGHGKGDEGGWFTVRFSATDQCDVAPAVSAVLLVEGIAKPISVSDGQVIVFERADDADHAKVKRERGRLTIEAAAVVLTVTAVDACGNTATAVARLTGPHPDDDEDEGRGPGRGQNHDRGDED